VTQQDAGLDIDYDAELAKIQSVASGTSEPEHPGEAVKVISGAVVDSRRTVTFMDQKFRIADKIGAMPLLKFSMYADMSVQDPKALAAMYAMLRDCIYPGTPGCGKCPRCAPERCGGVPGLRDRRRDGRRAEDDRPACRVNSRTRSRARNTTPATGSGSRSTPWSPRPRPTTFST
jgi:hypothetical protein